MNVTLLPDALSEAAAEVEAAGAARQAGGMDAATYRAALQATAMRWPASLPAWAALSALALEQGQAVEAYAFARVAYHRGLDRLRGGGWRGSGRVPWSHVPNRDILRAIHALLRAAEAIGETDEVDRCRRFLLDLDPSDPLGVRAA